MNRRKLVEVAVVVRTRPYSDGRIDVEARGLNSHELYQFKQDRYRPHLAPGDHLSVYRPATKGTVVHLEKLFADYQFQKLGPDGLEHIPLPTETPPEGAA